MLKLTKNISKKTLMKIGIFLVVIMAAWVFDYFHEGDSPVQNETDASKQQQNEHDVSCFYAAQATFSVKVPVQKVSFRKVFQEKFNRQELEKLNARSLFTRKAEILRQPLSFLLIKQLIAVRNYCLGNPDDLPYPG